MGSVERVDDRTFRVNFSGDGATKLRERVRDKLKEFMGDYTDDTLVEYVIVLLKNGRRKEEARNELNVFLGNDSDSFVSWLWDHLSSNLDTYVEHQECHVEEPSKTSILGDHAGTHDSRQLDSESEKGKSKKSRHNREWKGLVRNAAEPPPLLSSEVENMQFEEKPEQKGRRDRRSRSPQPSIQRKRTRLDDSQHAKKEPAIDAPRRLLQFAVRDALGTSRPSNSAKEPVVKRLRSVVSTATGDSSSDHPRRIQSVARVANPMATAIKAVAEAAEDVIKFKASGSVFDRLSRGAEISEFREAADRGDRDQEYGDFNKSHEQRQQIYHRMSEYSGEYVGNRTMLESETALTSDSFSDNEGYDDLSIIGHRRIDEPQSDTYPVNTDNDSRMVQYNVGNNAKNVMWVEQTKDEAQPAAASTVHRKIVNVSANVNTWKPPNCLETREVTDLDGRRSVQQTELDSGKFTVQLKENNNPVPVGNGNVKPATNIEKESLKTLMPNPGAYTAGRPLEDADSRTIFVSNVHFAATKDSLSRHFNKFGEVLKVVIVTDAATGQPKGSAYVEFMRKEAADNALSLDGTSFMSRILKVVKRSSAQQETAPIMTWSRTARGSAYTGARFARVPFPRGVPGVFRPRLMVKPGARSMQWKRDAQVASAESGSSGAGNSGSIPTPRSLTYIRTEPKSEGVQVQHNLAI